MMVILECMLFVNSLPLNFCAPPYPKIHIAYTSSRFRMGRESYDPVLLVERLLDVEVAGRGLPELKLERHSSRVGWHPV